VDPGDGEPEDPETGDDKLPADREPEQAADLAQAAELTFREERQAHYGK
jgi:hypothetical protein